MSPRNPSSATRAPYQVGERVKVMWLEPGAGTVAGTRPVTGCTPREDGGWRLVVAVGVERAQTYFLSPTEHSDFVTPIPKLVETQRARRGHDFFPPSGLAVTLPAFYATEGVDLDAKVLHAHFFLAPVGDWWVAEYRPETGSGLWAMNDAGWEHPRAAPAAGLVSWFQVEVSAVASDRPLPVQPLLRCAEDTDQARRRS